MTDLNYPYNDTAILLFSRSANAEAETKGYGKVMGRKNGVVLAQALITHTFQQAKRTTLPVLTHYSEHQSGNNFGERLANAMEQSFALGYQNLIVIGTDCPSITSATINNAAQQLKENDVVLGPSTDGGIYLLGIRKEAYSRESILQISWLTQQVFSAFTDDAFIKERSIGFCPIAEDIDNIQLLLHWNKSNKKHFFSLLFQKLLGLLKIRRPSFRTSFLLSPSFFLRMNWRGPPLFVA